MPCCYPLVEKRYKLSDTLIKEYIVEGVNEAGNIRTLEVKNNHQRFVVHNVEWNVKKVRFIPITDNGCGEFRVFDFEVS